MKFETVTKRTRGREGDHSPVVPIRTCGTRRGNCREDDEEDGAAKRLEHPEFNEGIVDVETETAIRSRAAKEINLLLLGLSDSKGMGNICLFERKLKSKKKTNRVSKCEVKAKNFRGKLVAVGWLGQHLVFRSDGRIDEALTSTVPLTWRRRRLDLVTVGSTYLPPCLLSSWRLLIPRAFGSCESTFFFFSFPFPFFF